jgi:glutamyl-tRNA reductase
VDLEHLLVVHNADSRTRLNAGEPVFRLSTCQRDVEVYFPAPKRCVTDSSIELHRGIEGYRLLLEIATGLRSAIAGETNVFGQLRAAWRDYLQRVPAAARSELGELIEMLFEDTRAIRTRFLQDIGGNSYGTLTRKILRAAPGERVLIVGSGELARSVAPMLTGFELAIINRSRPVTLPDSVQRAYAGTEGEAAVAWADHVVLCVPRHPELDARWLSLLVSRPSIQVIHLGCRRADAGRWAELRGFVTLDDLFDLRLAQQDRRSRQLELARAACRTRALLRAAESHAALQLPRGIA